ncbi:GumN protein [gut metagenome]|uniref:GumN protein n=1 Tax=gut metagenome TaxID=749906 RepID=J9CYU9_9ZZZZ
MKQRVLLLFLSVLFVCSASAQLLWKVEGKDLAKPSYIMGTQHLAKQSFVDSVPGLRDAFAVCEQVYGELSHDALTDPVAVQRMQLAMMLPGEQTIDQVLSADEMARLNAFMTQWMGADFSNPMLQPMKRMTPAALNAQFQLLMGIKMGLC